MPRFFLVYVVAPIRRPLRLRMLRPRCALSWLYVVRMVVDARVCTRMHAVCLSCLAASLVGLLSCLLSLSAPCWSGFCFVFPCVWKLCLVLLCCFCFLFVLFIRASSFKLVGVLSIIVFLFCISTGTPFVCYGSSYVDMFYWTVCLCLLLVYCSFI